MLLIEDNPGDARLVRELLGPNLLSDNTLVTIDMAHAERLKTALSYLQKNACDLILLDLSLPDANGLPTFQKLNKNFP